MGACAADFDNDGDMDIFQVNGYSKITQSVLDSLEGDTTAYKKFLAGTAAFVGSPSKLFINDGAGRFSEQASTWAIDDKKQGRGISCFDSDRDGDIDVVIANNSDKPSFYLNQVSGMANANFISIRLLGLSPNTSALGAKIRLVINGKLQIREVNLNSNYLSNNLPDVNFGLGAAQKIDEISIVWPKDGKVTTLKDINVNQFLVIKHPNLQ